MSYLSLLRCCSALLAIIGFWGVNSRAEDLVPMAGPPPSAVAALSNLPHLPLRFEANGGQTDPQARFLARGRGFTIYLAPGEAILALSEIDPTAAEPVKGNARGRAKRPGMGPKRIIQNNLRLSLPGANVDAEITGAGSLGGPASYFIGNDSGRWAASVPVFERVRYREIYPGIDLVFYGDHGQLEYDFNIRPGANPGSIQLQFTGADNLALTDSGELIISIGGGHLRWKAPVAFQETE
ncbi:MAG: hypothetical protein QOF48_2892, partial [Verrucomicrobiota bacterium]